MFSDDARAINELNKKKKDDARAKLLLQTLLVYKLTATRKHYNIGSSKETNISTIHYACKEMG
jgi:hypothetical protein